jgi:hypothetical protein
MAELNPFTSQFHILNSVQTHSENAALWLRNIPRSCSSRNDLEVQVTMCIMGGSFSVADGALSPGQRGECRLGTSMNRVMRSLFESEREKE